MEYTRVLIASKDPASLQDYKKLFLQRGYSVIGTAKDGLTALNEVREKRPDLIILDYELPKLNGLEVAKIIEENKLASVLLIASQENKEIIEITLYLTAEMALANFNRIRQLEKELEELKGSLESRKKIERAKGILMQQSHISEEEAFKRLQKISMDKRTSMEKIAEAIILTKA